MKNEIFLFQKKIFSIKIRSTTVENVIELAPASESSLGKVCSSYCSQISTFVEEK
jgi:hypothetical protein